MDDVVYQNWEKKLGTYNLSESQILNPCGDCSFSENVITPNETDYSGEYASEAHPPGKFTDELDLPESVDESEPQGKYAKLMRHRIILEERLRVVSPERTAEIMKLCPPDDIGRPFFQKSWVDERTVKYGPLRMEARAQYRHKADQVGGLLDQAAKGIYGAARRKPEPDGLVPLICWSPMYGSLAHASPICGRTGRTCSALHPSDEDWIWFKNALDDRWIPPMHKIVSIAGAGGDERDWQEKQINHSRGDRTGLGHSLDKIKRPSWAKRSQTLAFALNQKFPGLKDGRKPPQQAIRLFEAMDVIWNRKETALSESQRAAMRKQLERFRHFGLGLGKEASGQLAGIEELLRDDLYDYQGDPVKIAFVFLWVSAGFLSDKNLKEFMKSREEIQKNFSDLVEQGRDVCRRIEALENGDDFSYWRCREPPVGLKDMGVESTTEKRRP